MPICLAIQIGAVSGGAAPEAPSKVVIGSTDDKHPFNIYPYLTPGSNAVASPRGSVIDFTMDANPINLQPRLTPIPEKVSTIATPRIELNGKWRFHPNPPPEFWKKADETGWSDIQVPGEWVMQGFRVKPRQAAGYRLRFAVPADWPGHRIKIRFNAVYSKADVWLNGVAVGSHLGAFTPFEVDATQAVQPGKENVLALAVTSDSLADALAVGLEMTGKPCGGIIRKVSMFAVPEVHASSFHVDTTFDGAYRDAVMHVRLDVANETGKASDGAQYHLTLREHGSNGTVVAIASKPQSTGRLLEGQVQSFTLDVPVSSPKKWDAEHPNLYVLTCHVKIGDRSYTTQRRFGFRQIEIRKEKFLVNGMPIRLRGMSRQETHPLTGRTVSLDVHKQDIQHLLESNCNNTYCCAFLPDEEFLDLCDEAGIYVMDEPGTCWIFPHTRRSGFAMDDPKLFPYQLQPVLEMIERDRSHACIIAWMLADESPCGRNFRDVLKMARAVAPNKPIHMAYPPPGPGSPFDFGCWHYPNPAKFAAAVAGDRPGLFDQSVSAYFANVHDLMTDPGLRDSWGRLYEVFWEKLWAAPAILGGQAFNLNDDQYLVPNGPVTGTGDWGYVDAWRRPKPELWHIKKIHTPVKIKDAPIPVPGAGQPLQIAVENRYDFTNLSEVQIQWVLGGESGGAQADVPPHQKGVIRIRPRGINLSGKTLELTIRRNGMLIDAYKLPIGPVGKPAAPAMGKASQPVEVVESGKAITVKTDGFEWIISRETGQIVTAGRAGKPALVGGPVLMLLPTKGYPLMPGFPLLMGNPDRIRPQSLMPVNMACEGWKATSVAAKPSAGAVEIVVTGQYQDVEGGYTLRIAGGDAELSYNFTYTGPEKKFSEYWPPFVQSTRQIGMVWYAPRSFDTLSWQRKAQWSVYPGDHIGRPEGEVKALPDPGLVAKAGRWMDVAYREKPTWPWSADANELGTRDFRATRPNIIRAALKDPGGNALGVLSDGAGQQTRAFLDGERVGLLVAYYSGPSANMPGLQGMEQIAGVTPLVLKKGMELKDGIRLSLNPQDSP